MIEQLLFQVIIIIKEMKIVKTYHWLISMGIVFIVLGVYREETLNILTNASMLCYSCIGLG